MLEKKRIAQIIDEIGLSETLARALLLKFEWNSSLVINKFLDDPDLLKKQFNVDLAHTQSNNTPDFYCPVCYEQS